VKSSAVVPHAIVNLQASSLPIPVRRSALTLTTCDGRHPETFTMRKLALSQFSPRSRVCSIHPGFLARVVELGHQQSVERFPVLCR
jgi:hypothetical protein